MRMLALVTDAFGSSGGMAKFNRDFLRAACAHPRMTEVVALPLLRSKTAGEYGTLPKNLRYLTQVTRLRYAARSRYWVAALQAGLRYGPFDVVVCGHVYLLPMARALQKLRSMPMALITHGIEAWQPSKNARANAQARRIDALASVSEITQERFATWAGLPKRHMVLPNTVDLHQFTPGAKDPALLQRYNLHSRKVLLTVGRMAKSERYKGFDAVLELLPHMRRTHKNLVYLIVGDGDDRPRLQNKAHVLGVANHVIFTGYIDEREKAAHYRLGDCFVMPGRGEGFGVVYLEAMACGIPVVGSIQDGSREALRQGLLGILVEPTSPDSIENGIMRALAQQSRQVPMGLDYFDPSHFTERVHRLVDWF